MGRWSDNRTENSYLHFRHMRSLQKLSTVHASVSNLFNEQRERYWRSNYTSNRAAALTEWRQLSVD